MSSLLIGSISLQTSALAEGAKSLFYRQINNSQELNNIGLTYSIELIRKGKTALVDSRYPFESGDQLRFHVQSNVNGFLYIVLQQGSKGESALLFPSTAEDNNQVRAGADTLVPAHGVLEFDNAVGTEKVKLIVSAKQLQGDPNSFSRSIIITPKHTVDSKASQCMIDFALSDSSQAVFRNKENPPAFAKEPAVTIVSSSARQDVLAVEMDLNHAPKSGMAGQNDLISTKLNRAGAAPSESGESNSCPAGTGPGAGAANAHLSTTGAAAMTDAGRVVKDKWAVIVGISDFKDARYNLMYPAKDAEDLANFLQKEGHFAADHIKVLTNANATRENILTTLGSGWLPRNAKPDDLVFVYFATHGTAAAQDVAKKNFLVAYDTDPKNAFASGIELQDLARTIKRRISADRIIIVLDTCHSAVAEPGAKSLFPPESFSFEDLLQGTGQLIIASAGQTQIAHDSMRYKNGIFTKHFIDGLRQNKALRNAFEYTRKKVDDESEQDFKSPQTPVLKDSEWHGSGVVLVVPPAQPRKASN